MKLLGNRILIEPIEEASGPIEAPQLSKRVTPFGRVAMLGDGPHMPPELAIGQRVHVDVDRGHVAVAHEGRPHRIVSVLDVQLIFADA